LKQQAESSSFLTRSRMQQELAQLKSIENELLARMSLEDPYVWLTQATKTKDEQAPRGVDPYRPFPKRPYFKPLMEFMNSEALTYIRKSRTVMGSWLVTGWACHKAFTTPATRVVFQSKDEVRALKLIEYAKTLWDQSVPQLQSIWRVRKHPMEQAYNVFELLNGSKLVAIVGDPDKVRSEHPTIYIADEAAFMEDGEESMNVAAGTRVPCIISISSVCDGWFNDVTEEVMWEDWPEIGKPPGTFRHPHGMVDSVYETLPVKTPCYGMSCGRNTMGAAVVRLHYSADPDLTQDMLATIRKGFSSPAMWAQEMEMDAHASDGAIVYPEFDPTIHVIDDDRIPHDLTRFMALDPHPRTPWAMLWAGVDRFGDIYLYREFWPSAAYGRRDKGAQKATENDQQYTTWEYADFIAKMEGNEILWDGAMKDSRDTGRYSQKPHGEKVLYRYMDQAGKGFRVSAEGAPVETISTKLADCGLYFDDPIKSHDAGEAAVRDWLRSRVTGDGVVWPRLHVARSLTETIVEFQTYRYKVLPTKSLSMRDVWQEGVKARCHMIDLIRYLATSNISYSPRFVS
jgi:hypothetical protein